MLKFGFRRVKSVPYISKNNVYFLHARRNNTSLPLISWYRVFSKGRFNMCFLSYQTKKAIKKRFYDPFLEKKRTELDFKGCFYL